MGTVHHLQFARGSQEQCEASRKENDALLVEAMCIGDPLAATIFFDRYGKYVERILLRTLGADPDLEDLLHDTFIRAIRDVGKLRDRGALRPWLARIAVHTARDCIRARKRKKWLVFLPADEIPEAVTNPTPESSFGEQQVYEVMEKLPTELRLALCLRRIHGMSLGETAAACGTSLATIKRRIAKAEDTFRKIAQRNPHLRELCNELEETP